MKTHGMRILFIVHHFFPDAFAYAGTERYVLNLAKQMQRMGHSVRVLTYTLTDSSEISRKTEGSCQYMEYTYQGVSVISVSHRYLSEDVSFYINNKEIESFLREIIFIHPYDVVHVAHPMRLGSVVNVAKSQGIPVVLMLCDFWLICPRGILLKPGDVLCSGARDVRKCTEICFDTSLEGKLERRYKEAQELFYQSDVVTSRSRFLRDIFHENGWKRDIVVDTLGVDYSVVRGDVGRKYDDRSRITFGFIGTVQHHKGVHVLMEAFRKVDLPNISLEIWGGHNDSNYYEDLKRLARKDKRISFKGKYDYEVIYDVLKRIDIGVVPSIWWENAPQVLLALFSNRVPAIVSRVGGMTELVSDGVDGFHFNAGGSEELAGIIRRIGRDPSILNSLRQNVKMTARFEEEAFEYEQKYLTLKQGGENERGFN